MTECKCRLELEDIAVVNWVDPRLPTRELIARIVQVSVEVDRYFTEEEMFRVNTTEYDSED